MEEGAKMTLETVLGNLKSIGTTVIDMGTTALNVVESNPIVLLFVLLPLCGIGIGVIKRFIP